MFCICIPLCGSLRNVICFRRGGDTLEYVDGSLCLLTSPFMNSLNRPLGMKGASYVTRVSIDSDNFSNEGPE